MPNTQPTAPAAYVAAPAVHAAQPAETPVDQADPSSQRRWRGLRALSRRLLPLRSLALAAGLVATLLSDLAANLQAQDADAQPQIVTIFPREYGETVNEETVVGAGGRLVLVQTPEGDEIEVVEWAPPRSEQREKDIPLFTTKLDPKRKQEMLERPVQRWQNGVWKEATVQLPDEIDRTIYRVNSEPYDAKIEGLYETKVLDTQLDALYQIVMEGVKSEKLPAELAKTAAGIRLWKAANAQRRDLSAEILWARLQLTELATIPSLQASLVADAKTATETQARLTTLDAEIAALETKLGDTLIGPRPKGDPVYRERDVKRFEAWDCRADLAWLEQHQAATRTRIERAMSTVLKTVPKSVGELDEAAKAALLRDPTAAQLKAMTEALEAWLTINETVAETDADTAALLRRNVATLHQAIVPAADQTPQLPYQIAYQAAFPTGAPTAIEQTLSDQAAAIQAIPTIDFGLYKLILWSRLEGIENCLGTPVVVRLGGVERQLFSYQWPDSETIHPIEFDIELREPEAFRCLYTPPEPRHSILTYTGNYDRYNQTRAKGWQFAGSDTLHDLAAACFGPEKATDKPPKNIFDVLYNQSRRFNGVVDLSISLAQTRRRTVRGMGGPDASIDAVQVDAIELEALPEPPAVLRQVFVQKAWHRPGDANGFMAWLHNRTDAPQTGTLTTWVIHGIDERVQIDSRQVEVGPRSYQRVAVPWQSTPDAPLWGYTVRMEFSPAGTPAGTPPQAAEEVFSVHPNTFAVMMHGGHRGWDPYRQHVNYTNHAETFSATYCDSVYMLPDDLMLPYVRSMSDVLGDVLSSRAEVQRNHMIGVGSVHYLSPLCTGSKSYEMYLTHPEWFPRRLLWTEDMHWNHVNAEKKMQATFKEQGDMSWYMNAKTRGYHLLHLEQPINFASRDIFDNLVEDLITYSSVVDWDGTRWDGGPMLYFPNDFLGREVVDGDTGGSLATIEARKAIAARRMKELKTRVRAAHPHWVYGNNGDTFNYGASFLSLDTDPPPLASDPHYAEFMSGGGSYMDEGWMNAYIYADNRNKAEDYLKLSFKQAMGMKAAGGYLQAFSPARDGAGHFNVDHIYYTLLPHLTGATYYGKLSASPWSNDGPIVFISRFSEFFLNENLRPLPDAANRVDVDAPNVWYHEAATIEPISADHVRVIVPIINRHPRERLYDNQNRYSELPRPITEPFDVTIRAPEGFENAVATVWELSCEPVTAARQVEATRDGDAVTFKLDGLSLFKVAVVDYRRAK